MIYPAIDIQKGKCVRLRQGVKEDSTIFSEDPSQIALKWQNKGAKKLHIVDLDGAFEGEPKNVKTIQQILMDVVIPIQVGGGIRNAETVEKYLSMGVDQVVIGTKAVESPEFIAELVKSFKSRVIIGIDAQDGFAAIQGWTEKTNMKATDFAKEMQHLGVKKIIYTDIAKDGMLQGPNFKAMEEMVCAVKMEVIASGGISKVEDVKNLSKLESKGLTGVIIGKALYTGAIQLEEVL